MIDWGVNTFTTSAPPILCATPYPSNDQGKRVRRNMWTASQDIAGRRRKGGRRATARADRHLRGRNWMAALATEEVGHRRTRRAVISVDAEILAKKTRQLRAG